VERSLREKGTAVRMAGVGKRDQDDRRHVGRSEEEDDRLHVGRSKKG
jgi:hypothetical protein